MFGFLKDKLKKAVGKFTKDVEKETVVEKKEVIVEEPAPSTIPEPVKVPETPKKQGFLSKIFAGKKETEDIISEKEELIEELEEQMPVEVEEKVVEKPVEKKQEVKVQKPIVEEKKPEVKPIAEEKKTEVKEKKIGVQTPEIEIRENILSIIINTPVSLVFDFTINPKKTPLWINDIIQEEVNETPVKIGSVYKNKNKKGKWTEYKVIEFQENKVFCLETRDKSYLVRYIYEVISENKTKLTYYEKGILESPFEIATLEKLKTLLEKEQIIDTKPEIRKVVEQPFIKEEPKPDLKSLKREIPKEEPEKKGFFTKITETFTKFQLSDEKFEELFWELEVVMLENNVAVEVIDKIKADMKKELMAGKMTRRGVEEVILSTLRNSIIDLFDVEQINLLKLAKSKKPYVITVIGVNGSGKTTSIAKLTHLFQKNGLKVVLAASDTFRAAAIQQLEEHATRLNTKLIKHDYNSDPAAVAFDAIKYAEAKDMDVVIIDTAGRLHSNTNLMKELEKVVRVCKPDIKIFVGESITGNDCVEQAKEFDRAVGIDAIILAKADVDEKGGAAISVSYVTQKPILYLGTGQTYDDLKEFDPRLIIDSLEL